jgi:hypothetical protein
MRRSPLVLAAALACGDGGPRDPSLTSAGSVGGEGSSSSAGSDDGADADASAGGGCPGECTPGDYELQSCPDACGEQARVCDDDCTWTAWSQCEGAGACSPGQVQPCGECMQQVCGATCQWGACTPYACGYVCGDSVRNGSEVCDDQALEVGGEALYLHCVTAEGGVAYVANNTGPPQMDGVARCQGWEDMMLNAWDYLDYVQMMTCDEVGKTMPIELPQGTQAWFGVHDQPTGGGHFTEVCVATLAR